MKLLFSLFIFYCGTVYSETLHNVKYGSDPRQVMDIYLPNNTSIRAINKCVVLIHGGGWSLGDKKEMEPLISHFQKSLPDYALVNMEYRLGNALSPGYPKQIEDVASVVGYIKSRTRNVKFVLAGGSAGAHLAMLYSYKTPLERDVKVIVDVVGPADLTAWGYVSNPALGAISKSFTGKLYWEDPGLFYRCSPVAWINWSSAKTIGFYGDNDPLIPSEQHQLLKKRLDEAGVTNEFYVYHGGHFDWSDKDKEDVYNKADIFIKKYM